MLYTNGKGNVMKQAVKEAVEYLVSTYKSVQDEARGWTLNPKDIEAALKEVEPDTAEYNVLMLLSKTNFVEAISIDPIETALNPLLDSLADASSAA